MSLLSKVIGYAARNYAKFTGKALARVSNVGGTSVKKFLKTGTEVIKDPEIGKIIRPGKGNFLNSVLGIRQINSYPKGSLLGGENGLVSMSFDHGFEYSCTPREFGQYIKDSMELLK